MWKRKVYEAGRGKRVAGSESLRYVRGERRECEVCREVSRSRRCIAQSRDHTTIVRNLGIPRMHNAILRLRKFSDCTKHIYVGRGGEGIPLDPTVINSLPFERRGLISSQPA